MNDDERTVFWAALDAEYADALLFMCSTCQAPAGSPCTMRSWVRTWRAPFHAPRIDRMLTALRKAQLVEARPGV